MLMRNFVPKFLGIFLVFFVTSTSAQVTLSGPPYVQTFDNIGTDSLPTGFTVRTGATAAALGTAAPLTKAATPWSNSTGRYSNYAAGGIGSGSTTAQQAAATNRLIGVRESGTFGDPGAAFVFQVANTSSMTGFTLDFELQSLDITAPRTCAWQVDYGFGANPSTFTTVTTAPTPLSTGGAKFFTTLVHADFGTALDNQSDVVTIRIVQTAASGGSGTRPVTGIDNFFLNWTNSGGGPSPTLSIAPSSLSFPITETGTTSSDIPYTLTASNLTDSVVVGATQFYTVSVDDVTFSSSLKIDPADASLATGKIIFVKFSPTIAGASTGSITNSSTGATSKVVGLSGTGISYIHLGGTSPYVETFDGIGSGLPAGVSTAIFATASSMGTSSAFISNKTSWTATTGGFYNYASANIGTSESQSTATDRALGTRQTSSAGDPGAAFIFQIANTTGKINFSLDFNLQSVDASSPRQTTWRVDYGFGNNPTSFIVPTSTGIFTTGGDAFSDNPIHIDFGNALDNQSGVVTIRIVTLSPSSGSGNRPSSAIDDWTLTWEDPSSKTISISTTSMTFPGTSITGSTTQSYTIVGQTHLDQPIVVTATAPYTVSSDSSSFSSSINVDPSTATNKKIFVRFSPTSTGIFSGTITNSSVGATSKTILLSGEGIDPESLSFNFNTCTISSIPGSGFLSINTQGSQMWGCSQFGHNSTNGASVNGFANGAAQADTAWLISPSLDLSHIVNMPVLSFYSRGEFTGPKLQLFVSTDYDGSGNPNNFTWTEITNANFPTPPGTATTTWTLSDNIDLSPYKSSPKVYLAFKYTSSALVNAARWTIDDVLITDQSTLLTVSPSQLSFGEEATGTSSPGQPVSMQAISTDNNNITVTPPAGYQLSTDNVTYSSNPLVIDPTTAAAGTSFYVRFAPVVKALKVEGFINLSAPGLNKNSVSVTGSSYPKAETFDAACYNLSFFGSNSSNTPTPGKITLQINNISTVMQHLNVDAIGVEEVSSDSAFNVLVSNLPGYAGMLSPRWSFSFNPPDPTFPPQKVGFIYNTATMTLSATEPPRALFADMYDSVRNGLSTRLSGYPSDPSQFFSSGRLPFMAVFDVNVNGQTKTVRMIDIHAKSASDILSYNRRVFDAQVLKDTIDAFYKNDNVIIVGDYNDRVDGSIHTGSLSPYKTFVDDKADYNVLTFPLDSAGKLSFVSGTGMIDHMIITNPLQINSIPNSTDIEDARLYIPNYDDSTASDHLPVFSRFALPSAVLPVTLLQFTAKPANNGVLVNWTTAAEQNSIYFSVERSADGSNFTEIARVSAAGKSNRPISYQSFDANPLPGTSYYRLKQVDLDGKSMLSKVAVVHFTADSRFTMNLSPNPVSNFIKITLASGSKTFDATVIGMDGKAVISAHGDANRLNGQLNNQLGKLSPGVYLLKIENTAEHYMTKFVKL